jgi:hypothetical protein
MSLEGQFNAIYRGIVLDNKGDEKDPAKKGRVKVFIPGVYPDEFKDKPKALPWAEPAEGLFGGNAPVDDPKPKVETGIAGWVSKNSWVWIFFEHGNPQYPIYFAACQGGDGWISEHNKQWTFKSHNVRIRVDEDPELKESTCKHDSYNSKCTEVSKKLLVKDIPTRVDMEISGNVHVFINGKLNMHVSGDVYEEIIGNKHETIVGNIYTQHNGCIFSGYNRYFFNHFSDIC